MSVTLTGIGGLFTILGRLFHALNTLNTARGTTVPDEVVDLIDAFEALSNSFDVQEIIDGVETDGETWQGNQTLANRLRTIAEKLVIYLINADNQQEDETIRTAVLELIAQMEGSGGETNPDNSVDASTAAISVSADSGNNTDGVIIASAVRGDARNAENAIAEDIVVEVSSIGGTGSVRLEGEPVVSDRLSHLWPGGSGMRKTLTGVNGSSSLLSNGGFDDEDDRDNTPDDWIVYVGTIGTTIKMTNYEVQSFDISGTPTSGTYTVKFTDVNSNEYFTDPLAYNASGTALQSALREIPGLSEVEVATTGTAPNYSHTITFKNMFPPGNIGNLSATNTFDTGSITPGEDTAGSAHVYKGKAVEFDSNGSELTQIRQLLTGLSPRTSYAFNCFMKVDVFPAAGVITVDLCNGAGTVISDVQGTNNTFTINPQSGGDLSTSAFTAVNGFFRTPTVVPDTVYLRIRISTAISTGTSLFIDEAAFVQATELYTGGPLVAFFAGTTPLGVKDKWTITTTNDRAGEFQEQFFRHFKLDDLLLPSDSGGSETISDDTLIS